ncbi:MAG TPA: right-handed parallel beta-helix repeat-containing protein [bacterium]|nr:right-handed parallel beta-helix repeat-containing protein [bacterium]
MKDSRNVIVLVLMVTGLIIGGISVQADTTGVAVESDQTVVSEGDQTVVIKDGEVTVITEKEEAAEPAVVDEAKKPVMEETSSGAKGAVMEKKADQEPVMKQKMDDLPPVPDGLTPHAPLFCDGLNDMNITGVHIDTDQNGADIQGNCDAMISNCYISSEMVAVHVHGNAEVTLNNCVLVGKGGAVIVSGNAEVTLKNCTIKGAVQSSGNAEIMDGGGNTYLK